MTTDKYITVVVNARSVRRRNPVALRADILKLLASNGATGKRRIINELRVGQESTDEALRALRAEGKVEKYKAMSIRNRMDELWCLAGESPVKRRTDFRGADTLAALQRAVARSLGITPLAEAAL